MSKESWMQQTRTENTMHQNLMPKPISQSSGLRCMSAVKTVDCIPPTVHIHAVSESWAGYLFRDDACHFHTQNEKDPNYHSFF